MSNSIDGIINTRDIDNEDFYSSIEEQVIETVQSEISTTPASSMSDGTELLPGLPFLNDVNTGIFRIGNDNLGISTGGFNVLDLSQGSSELQTTSFVYKPLTVLNTTCDFACQVGDGISSFTDLFRVDESNITASVPFLAVSGTESSPGLSFVSDTDTGFFKGGTNQLSVATGGNEVFQFGSTDLRIPNGIQLKFERQAGTYGQMNILADPSINSDFLIESIGGGGRIVARSDRFTVKALGVDSETFIITSSDELTDYFIVDTINDDITISIPFYQASGSALAPSYAFSSDVDSGIYSIGSGQVGISCNGVLQVDIDGSQVDFAGDVNIAGTLTFNGAQITFEEGYDTEPAINFTTGLTSGINYKHIIDEDNWSADLSPSGNNTIWKAVIWEPVNAVFIATGEGGVGDSYEYVAYSADGDTWTTTTSIDAFATTNMDCRGIAYSPVLDRFVIVGASADEAIYSDDAGVNWSVNNGSMTESNNWNSIAYSDTLDLFVAVADSGTNRVARSSNGTSWTLSASPSVRSWANIIWDSTNEIFISVNSSGSSTEAIMTSADGSTWTHRATPSGLALFGLAHSPELNFTLAFSSTTTAFKSTDGITWTSITVPDIDSVDFAIWTGNMFFVTGLNGKYMYSYDGANFTEGIQTTTDWLGCAYSSSLGKFVMVGESTDAIISTDDLQGVNLVSGGTQKLSVRNNWTELNYYKEDSFTGTFATSPATVSTTFYVKVFNNICTLYWDALDVSYTGTATLLGSAQIPEAYRPALTGVIQPVRVREDATIGLGAFEIGTDGGIVLYDTSTSSNQFTSRVCLWGSSVTYNLA